MDDSFAAPSSSRGNGGDGTIATPDLPAAREPIDFSDDGASKYESDFEWKYSRGITEGTSATTLNPTGSVTRGQTEAFLHRALGS